MGLVSRSKGGEGARSRLDSSAESNDGNVDATDNAIATATRARTALASSSKSATDQKQKPIMTRAQLAQRIAQGETLVLHRQSVYKLDSWLSRHPGGELAILHFVGRDATDELEAYHCDETLRRMRGFAIATLDDRDWRGHNDEGYNPLVPPVQLGYRSGKLDHPDAQWTAWTAADKNLHNDEDAAGHKLGTSSLAAALGRRPQGFPLPVTLLEPPPDPAGIVPAREKAISEDYRRMHDAIKSAGLYALHPSGYAREFARYVLLATLAAWTWSESWYIVSSFFLGMLWHQLAFTVHDAGHCGITHDHFADRLIGSLLANYVGGLSIGWWCDNHDVHHLVTNHPEHDPDIQHMPFFAISPRFLVQESPSRANKDGSISGGASGGGQVGLWSSYYRRVLAFDLPSRLFLRVQHKVYYVVMSLGRFNLYANSYGFLALKARRDKWFWIESTGIVVFWYWFAILYLGAMPTWSTRLASLMISHIVTSPLHVQIVLSHFAQSSEDLGLRECFASRQIRTTMDVLCPAYLDFLHGGLHMQVTHHLFPRLPRHNLRETRDRFVRPFAQKWGLSYEEYTFQQGNGKVLRTLEHVANQVKVLARVAQAQAHGELH